MIQMHSFHWDGYFGSRNIAIGGKIAVITSLPAVVEFQR